MKSYEALASAIVKDVGGRANIKDVTHCLTRLRFSLVDDSKVDQAALAGEKDIVTTQFAGGKFQVVIGAQVGDVYSELTRQLGGIEAAAGNASAEKGSLLDRFTAIITQVMTPALGVLCGCSIIAGLGALLISLGVITQGDGTQLILNAMGNACLTFFPVILGYTSAKAFGMNPFTGMILGCVLIFPGLTEAMSVGETPLYTLFSGSALAMPVYQTFLGIPVLFPSSGYASTVIPIIFATFVASKVERWANRVLPQAAHMFVTPMITVLVAGTIALLVVGPLSILLTNLISMGLNSLLATVPIIAYVIFALVYQPLVIFGLHWALITLGFVEFATTGSTLLIGLIFPASFAHLAVCAAVMLRSKVPQVRETGLAAVISACFCIIEPSIYGITLPVKKRFGICMLAGTVGAIVMGLTGAKMFAIAMGATGFASFIDPSTGAIQGMLSCFMGVGVTMVVGFALAWITYKPSDDALAAPGLNNVDASESTDASTAESARHRQATICSPVSGTVKPLEQMSDPAFSGGAMGQGVCVEASEGSVVAPCDGMLTTLFPTGHAFGITGDDGIEVLVHVGCDTVQLPEGTFEKHAFQGNHVSCGDIIVSFDPEAIRAQGCSLETAVIVTNSADYLEVLPVASGAVKSGDKLLTTLAGEAQASAEKTVPAVTMQQS